ARIFAKTINCLNPTPEMEACNQCESCLSFNEGRSYSIHELDAASNNSVEDIRQLIEQVRIPPQIGQYSVYIIDEVHMLSSAAFNAFLKTLEEPPAHAIFILATTEKHKIIPTILSRCQIYDFNRIRVEDTVEYLKFIAEKESVTAEDAALHIIAQKADGAMRDALSIFDQVVSFCGNNLTYTQVIENLNVLDYDYYFRLTKAFLAGSYTNSLLIFNEILGKGFEAQHFVAGLCTHFRDLLVCKDPQTVALLEASESIKKQYVEQAAACDAGFLFNALNLANRCDVGYKASGNPRLHVELCLLQISNLMAEKKSPDVSEVKQVQPAESLAAPKVQPVAPPAVSSAPAAPAPAVSVAPAVAAPKTIQLKNVLSGNVMPQEKASQVSDNEIVAEELEFSVEQFQAAFEQLITSQLEHKTRLKLALQQASRELKDSYVIVLQVNNSLHFTEMKTEEKYLTTFLQKQLRNKNIVIEVMLEAAEVKSSKPYSSDDRFKYLAEKNPVLKKFKQELSLDYD
ncbi:MAG: DNA polymerase III subunit gamma/tau, partial [Prevotellaceae bacterium]|nr:DNA polymerase III subunit gamma/tau [Prevotellaceae bacterium]